jgi:hypothetical protein
LPRWSCRDREKQDSTSLAHSVSHALNLSGHDAWCSTRLLHSAGVSSHQLAQHRDDLHSDRDRVDLDDATAAALKSVEAAQKKA